MTTATGTVTGHNNLLLELRDFLVDIVGWTELDSDITSPIDDLDTFSLSLRAPGATAGNEFFLNIITGSNIGSGFYGWSMRAATDYDADEPHSGQVGTSPAVYFNTWQNEMDYWFYANDRRVIVVAKVNTSYVSMYAGLFLPFALPTEWLRPFYIAGNYPELASYDVSNTRNRFIADPGTGCAHYLTRSGVNWQAVENQANGSGDVDIPDLSLSVIWPHRTGKDHGITGANGTGWQIDGLSLLRPNLSGEMPNFLCHIVDKNNQLLAGTLEGVYGSPGFGKTSEQVVTVSGADLRMFQNIFRTTGRDFMGIREE